MSEIHTLLEKINNMEMKLAFQEDLLHSLEKIVARQDKEIQKLWDANRLLKQGMNEMKDPGGSNQTEPPPPHY